MAEKKKKLVKREAPIPAGKVRLVKELEEKIKKSQTIFLASTKGLPAAEFQKIKKKLRGKVDVYVAKRSLVLRAIENSGKKEVKELEILISSDIALMFSDIDAFELSGMLSEMQSPTKAKIGDVAPEDIIIEPGPTELVPGPAISELSGVGLKVAVEGGKLAIKQPHTVVKQGEKINDKVAGVLGKLNITPMKVGFIPVAAFDAKSGKVYTGIRIDKKKAYEELKVAIAKSLNFAVNMKYVCEKTIGYFIAKAGLEEKALENLISKPAESASGEGN
jgi:large subunit ribosomal protein L10